MFKRKLLESISSHLHVYELFKLNKKSIYRTGWMSQKNQDVICQIYE